MAISKFNVLEATDFNKIPLNINAIKELACAVIKKARKDCDAEFFESEDVNFWAALAYGTLDFKDFESVARQCREDRNY